MTRREVRATGSLAAVFAVRLFGLFLIYPVFAVYAQDLRGATPATIGLALGIYGLTQGLLQIPFGLMSDRIGRKVMIVAGLLLFAAGSAVAALAGSIHGVIVGRALQGAGAVGSVILSLVADLTDEESRTSAMAVIGVSIGVSFMIALVAGPILAHLVGVSGIFWLMAALGLVAIAVTEWIVPTPRTVRAHRDAMAVPDMLGRVLRNSELLRLDFGVFVLQAMLTASFLAMPGLLHATLSITPHDQWIVYLPVVLIAAAVMVPAIVFAEKRRRMKPVFVAAVGLLAVSQMTLFAAARSPVAFLTAMTLFFVGFMVMEACLPSLVTKTAPPDAKGTASGVYSSGQFLGVFAGGMLGGWAHQLAGNAGVFALTAALACLWLIVAATMKRPGFLVTRLLRIDSAADPATLAASLRALPGVADAAVVPEEETAYLKVDAKIFDVARAKALAGVV